MATDPELTALLAKSVETVKAMSPEERNAMIAKQAESYARSLQPCEHGMVDFEQCEQCRTPTNGEKE